MLGTDRGTLRAAPAHRNTRRYLQYSYKCLNTTPGSLDPTGLHLIDKLTINISVENFTNQSRHMHGDALGRRYPYYRRSINDFSLTINQGH